VKALAAHNPACIYLAARKIPLAEALIDTIHQQHPNANIVPLQLDLSTFDSIKKCAAEFNSKSDRLDLLFLNAGIAGTAPSLTTEGYETQFGVNHVGHALLSQLLMPKLLATQKQPGSDVRIMVTSSVGAHQFSPKSGIQLDKMKTTADSMNTMVRYGHSKLANALFARKLAQVYPGITATSHHPGTVGSEIWGKADGIGTILTMLSKPIVWLTAITSDKGAETGLWTATVDKASLKNGGYYEPVGIYKERNKNATDPKMTDDLWEWTNKELAQHGGPGWPEA
jgi:NAD(P)-dependent dehydrogenase (short-subunit alcohol dehydrogenase family)